VIQATVIHATAERRTSTTATKATTTINTNNPNSRIATRNRPCEILNVPIMNDQIMNKMYMQEESGHDDGSEDKDGSATGVGHPPTAPRTLTTLIRRNLALELYPIPLTSNSRQI
jgi:hypothetical protein